MMKQDKRSMINKKDEDLKQIIKDIKKNYFVFLSSLKFQNIPQKKSQKDYKIGFLNPKQLVQTDITIQQSRALWKKKFSFEDQIIIENKGLIAYIQVVNSIKKLYNFNQQLYHHILKHPSHHHNNQKKSNQENQKIQDEEPKLYQ